MLAAALEAAKRDVLIEVGHGGGSFEYTVCAPALQQGLMPDIVTRTWLLKAVTLSATLTHGSCSRVKIIALRCGSRRFAVTRNWRSRPLVYIGAPILTSSAYLLANARSAPS